MTPRKRVIAYHLPQYHAIEQNDRWWGAGYTEWTCLKRWRPYFSGHALRMPGRLGYYNILDEGIIERQYELASEYGLEGFCFWVYWFGGGDRLLEKPLTLLLRPESKVKYCIAWANHDWFDKSRWLLLQKQRYLGPADYELFFREMIPHFTNKNYIKKDNKLVVSVFMPEAIPDFDLFSDCWNGLSRGLGFDGVYFVSDQYDPSGKWNSYFGACSHSPAMFRNRNFLQRVIERLVRYHNLTFLGPVRYSYPKMMNNIYRGYEGVRNFIPTIFSGWDTTPRHGRRGVILRDFSVDHFRRHVRDALQFNGGNDFVFMKSWNEWAEGNLIEPDCIFGERLLEVMKEELDITAN